MVPVTEKEVVRIGLYGPCFNQSNCEKASPYQWPCDKDIHKLSSLQ